MKEFKKSSKIGGVIAIFELHKPTFTNVQIKATIATFGSLRE
jgi:hypothetical protein